MIWELRHAFTIKLLLEVSGLARSTYYYYIKHRNDEDKYSEIKEQITNIFCENKERYGYRRITMELHNRGYRINHKAVLRLMNEEKIKCQVRIKKYHSYKGEVGKVAPNLLERDFSTTAPNEKWATDVTEFSIFGQKPKEIFHHSIIKAVAFSAHALNDPIVLKQLLVVLVLVLPALIRVHDQTLYRRKAFKCFVQHISYLLHVGTGREIVRNDLICIHVQNR